MKRYAWTAAVLILTALSIFSMSSQAASCEDGDRTAVSGALFKRDCSRPALGHAFRAPNGLIWGSVVMAADGKELLLTTQEAIVLCGKAGGRLPTAGDFARLIEEIRGNTAYAPQAAEGGTVLNGLNNWLTVAPAGSHFNQESQHFFVGSEGILVSGGEERGRPTAVGAFLCVAD